MAFTLPELPYARDALEPHMSKETLDFHYGKHHKTYVDKANGMIDDTEFANASLEEIIKNAGPGGLFNNCAQIWNHTFFWNGLTPGGSSPSSALSGEIDNAFGSLDDFKEKFNTSGAGNFGSGWTWLVKTADGKLDIVNTDDAENPMTDGHTPLLTADMWEHAYYIDYRNSRPKYLENFWALVNWDFVEKNLNA